MTTADRATVLVVGDANPDLVLRGDVTPRFGQAEQLLDAADLVLGGSAAITAHALARLDRPVSLNAAVGGDAFGEFVRTTLVAAGVDTEQLLTRAGLPTGVTVVLSRGDDRAILTHPGAIPSLDAAEVRAAIDALLPNGLAHVHVSSLFLQPGLARELADVLAYARACGLRTSLDTNDDPAGRWSGVTELLPLLDVLLPNSSEATAIGHDADHHRAAAALAAQGPLVVVKDGAAGAFAVAASGEVVSVPAVTVRAVDSTGAGDTFNAAFIDTLLDGAPVAACLRRAVVAGAHSVGHAGGTAGQPTRADLDHTSTRTEERP